MAFLGEKGAKARNVSHGKRLFWVPFPSRDAEAGPAVSAITQTTATKGRSQNDLILRGGNTRAQAPVVP